MYRDEATKRVAICQGVNCSRRGSASLLSNLESEVRERGIEDSVHVRPGACNKLCDDGPSMVVHPDKVWYARLNTDAIRIIVSEHLIHGKPVKRYIARDLGDLKRAISEIRLPF